MMRKNLEIDDLRKILRLEPETGRLYWLHRTDERPQWNGAFAGKEAFTSSHDARGYRVGSVRGNRYYAHRLVFALANGRWPEGDVDHINGCKSDNRPENLREATRAQNLRNTRISARNRSGYKGVSWHKSGKKWQATIRVCGKSTGLGLFDRIEDAAAAYDKAAIAAYGEFASTNQAIEMAPALPTKPANTEGSQ